MNTNARMTKAIAALAVVGMLSGCSTALITPEQREKAAQETADRLAEALATLDLEAIDELTCEDPWRVQRVQVDPPLEEPLTVEVRTVYRLPTETWRYRDPDPDAEFHLASFLDTVDPPELAQRVGLDAILRVDERGACLWAMDAPFVVFLGL